MFRFEVLGPLEVYCHGRRHTPSAPKLRRVLGLLLLRFNSVVSTDAVITELWDDEPPVSAMTTTHTYIYHLRKLLSADSQELLVTKPPGYLLSLDWEQLDANVYERLIEQGTRLLERGHAREASDRLREAQRLWKGPPLANTPCGRLLRGQTVRLEELRIRAIEARIEADMRIGRERMLVGELRSLVALHPLNEWFHARLIEVLHRSGRRAEALEAYQTLRRTLKDELGLEPAPELRKLQSEILTTNGSRSRKGVGTAAY